MKSFSGSDLEALLCNAATRCVFNKLAFPGVALQGSEWPRLLRGKQTRKQAETWSLGLHLGFFFFFLNVKLKQTNLEMRNISLSSKITSISSRSAL